MRPILLDSADWPAYAERLQGQIARMAMGSGGRYLACDIRAAIEAGHMRVWLAIEGEEIGCVLVTQVIDYPQARAMRCIGLVGQQPRRWLRLLHYVEMLSVTMFGCDRIEALHPPDKDRLMTTGNWSTFHILSEKRLCAA